MSNLRWLSLTILVGLAAVPPIAAQQRDTAVLSTTIITAERVPVPATASPVTTVAISGDDLRARGVRSVADALRDLPGVTIAESGSYGSLTSLFLRGGQSNYTKVLIDGVAVNDPGGGFDFATLTTDNVERIEVVRGPASVLYGANAVAGVIQIFTRSGEGKPRAIVSARAGSYGWRDADGTVLGAIPGGDFSASVARHETRGIYAFNSANQNTVGSGALHLVLDPWTDLRFTMRYTDDGFHYPTDGAGSVVDSNAVQGTTISTLGFEIGRRLTPAAEVKLDITSDETSASTDDRASMLNPYTFESLADTRRRAADLRANLTVPSGATFTVGGQLEQQDARSQNSDSSAFGQFSGTFGASRRNRAVYAELLSNPARPITLSLGDRIDQNERFGAFNTYRAGAAWAVTRTTHLRASLGTAFREPSFDENFAAGFVTGNPNLKPEHTGTWDATVSQTFAQNRASIEITRFAQRFKNLIDYSGDTSACGASYCNVARANADGQEFSARLTPVGALTLSANLTHLDTRVVASGFDTSSAGLYLAGQPLIRRPRTSWNAAAVYALRGLTLDARVMHVGDRSDRDFRPYPALPVIVPAYTRTDFGATVPMARERDAAITARVENAFGVDYQSVFNYKTPGRVVYFGLKTAL